MNGKGSRVGARSGQELFSASRIPLVPLGQVTGYHVESVAKATFSNVGAADSDCLEVGVSYGNLYQGEVAHYTAAVRRGFREVQEQLEEQAQGLGADGIIAMRYHIEIQEGKEAWGSLPGKDVEKECYLKIIVSATGTAAQWRNRSI